METTNFDLLYNYYLDININRRNEAIILLSDRNFDTLNQNYIHYFDKTQKLTELTDNSIDSVITQLIEIKNNTEINETKQVISSYVNKENLFHDKIIIYLTSYLYTIVPISKCENLAKHSAKNGIWKIEHQPNGKDTKGYLNILNKIKNNL